MSAPRESNATAWVVALFVGVLAGAIGPRAMAEHDRPAGEPFAYAAPAGFVPGSPDLMTAVDAQARGATRVWIKPSMPSLLGATKHTPNISVVHTSKSAPVNDGELAAIAAGMPQVFAESGTTWSELRHWTHVRAGGARVGVISGAASRGELSYRILQIAFPDDTGTSIVTASFPTDEAAKFEPEIEKTIDASTGVAFRAPPPQGWSYLAWGIGAAVLAFLAMGLRVRKPVLARQPAGGAR